MNYEIEVFATDVSDIEARVFARCCGGPDGGVPASVSVRGSIEGPFCETARTLPAQIAFRDTGDPGMAEAIVPDPCVWSEELPHYYRVHIEARDGEQLVAEYRGTVALRRKGGG